MAQKPKPRSRFVRDDESMAAARMSKAIAFGRTIDDWVYRVYKALRSCEKTTAEELGLSVKEVAFILQQRSPKKFRNA